MTNLFFDDNGSFKAGSVLSSTSATYQVELSTGKRTKVKGSKVFFSFEQPSPQAFMEKAQAQAAELDPSFLWEVAPKDEFATRIWRLSISGTRKQISRRPAS